MKLVTLNIWGGRVKEFNKEFFDKYVDVDVWCFQEMYHKGKTEVNTPGYVPDVNVHETVEGYLNNHHQDFCPVLRNYYGLSMFVHKDIRIIEKGEMLVAKGNWEDTSDLHNRDHHRKVQWFEMMIHNKKVLIINAHLTHRPEGKKDSEKRVRQSKIIIELLNMFDCPKILCGDFNLLPDTESIKMIEQAGLRNLVKEYNVTSTRTELYKKPLQFADYIFISPEIAVNDFKVLPDIVSDHAPLYLDFDL